MINNHNMCHMVCSECAHENLPDVAVRGLRRVISASGAMDIGEMMCVYSDYYNCFTCSRLNGRNGAVDALRACCNVIEEDCVLREGMNFPICANQVVRYMSCCIAIPLKFMR